MSEATAAYYLEEQLKRHDPDLLVVEAFVPSAARKDFRALMGTWFELRDPIYGAADPEVALARLGWWREEWQRLSEQCPRHPLTQQLAARADFAADDIDAGLVSVAQLLQLESCASWEEIETFVDGVAGSVATVERRLFEADQALLQDVWADVVSMDLLLGLAALVRKGRAFLPLDISAELQVTRQDLTESDRAHGRVVSALAEARTERAPQAVAGAHSWIYRAVLQRRVRAVSRGGRECGAIPKLWAAWRAARGTRSMALGHDHG
ncbi:MAG: squalene/phytoene synthase family protein [Xanthomonadales bacterium]|nr:squalene/phytoene synthase family protein [Xanthomonadales bacterium]